VRALGHQHLCDCTRTSQCRSWRQCERRYGHLPCSALSIRCSWQANNLISITSLRPASGLASCLTQPASRIPSLDSREHLPQGHINQVLRRLSTLALQLTSGLMIDPECQPAKTPKINAARGPAHCASPALRARFACGELDRRWPQQATATLRRGSGGRQMVRSPCPIRAGQRASPPPPRRLDSRNGHATRRHGHRPRRRLLVVRRCGGTPCLRRSAFQAAPSQRAAGQSGVTCGRRGARKGHDATPRIRNPAVKRRNEPQYADLPENVDRRLSSFSQASRPCGSSSGRRMSAGCRLASDGPIDVLEPTGEAPLSACILVIGSGWGIIASVQAGASSSPLPKMHADRELPSDRRVDFVAPGGKVPCVGRALSLSQAGVHD
jgi:hypothetical protein